MKANPGLPSNLRKEPPMPQPLLPLVTKLCQDLTTHPHDTQLCHLTLNIPLTAISAVFRLKYDESAFTTTFSLTPQHCLGAILVEPDGDYWPEPHLTTWTSRDAYLALFPKPVSPLPWTELLPLLPSVELILPTSRLFLSGAELAARPDLSTLLQPFN
jgi:hypothetical protein